MLNEHCKNEQQKRARLDRRNAKDRAKRSSEKGIEKEENDKQSLRMPSTEEMKEKGNKAGQKRFRVCLTKRS